MAKSLVIVESPAKAKTINKYLGGDFIVKSSVGHIRDLPTSGGQRAPVDTKERARQAAITRKLSPEDKIVHKRKKNKEQLIRRMGINPEQNWAARYEILPSKEKVVEELRKIAETADVIYLATDMDREGEESLGICRKPLVVTLLVIGVLSLMKSLRQLSKRRSKSQVQLIWHGFKLNKQDVS